MPSYTTYDLTFRTGLHLGRYTGPAQKGQLGLQKTEVYIPADTLFSALCQTWATFYGSGALQTFLNRYTENSANLPFRLTSAFPFAGNVRFFPKPVVNLYTGDAKDDKKVKNVQFVSHKVFEAILNGEPPKLSNDLLINGGKMWVDACEKKQLEALPISTEEFSDTQKCTVDTSEKEQLETEPKPSEKNKKENQNEAEDDLTVWKTDTRPRVRLDRGTHESQIWHVETLTFNKGCGLWFAVEFEDPDDVQKTDDKNKIHTLLWVLGDAGIGGERNAGYGLFEFEKKSAELDTAAGRSRFVTLAPMCPKSEDELKTLISEKDAAYSLNPRTGWGNSTGTPFRRKQVMMFDEGSVLTTTDRQVGRLVEDLEPDGDDACSHPVYRYGYAWPVGIKGGQP